MRVLLVISILCGLVHANEALDVLEGNKKASEVSLPPAKVKPGGTGPDRDSLAYIEPRWTESPLDSIWSRAILFEDTANPIIQQAAVSGFFDQQAAFGRARVKGAGNVDLDGSRTRRARLGSRLRLFRNTDLEAKVEFSGDTEYRGVEHLSGKTQIQPGISVQYGKFRPTFTKESSTEDEFLAYADRTMLVNLLAPASSLGVMMRHQGRDWGYGLGWFSSDYDPDFPNIQGDGFLNVTLNRTFVEAGGRTNRRIRWHFDYLHNFDTATGEAIPGYQLAGRFSANGGQLIAANPAYRHLFATGMSIDQDNLSFDTEVMFAKGNSTAWGLTLSPSYWLIPGTLKLVGRYHYAESENAGGLATTMGVSSDPLFDASPVFIGDEYQSFYIGANLHIYQNQLVLMSGFEQIELKDSAGAGFDTDATIWHAGAKLSF